MLSTDDVMTSLQRRMTATEGGSACRVAVRRDGVGQAVDVALNLLGGEADGSERVFDLVGDAAGDLLPGGLLLGAEEFGGVFEDEDVALMLAVRAVAASSRATVASRFMVLLNLPLRVRGRVSLDLAGGGAHAMAAQDEAVEEFGELGGEDLFDGACRGRDAGRRGPSFR